MFKLTVLLCATMFCVLLIAGEDRGQLRPGLANAPAEPALPTAVAEPVAVLATADNTPADVAPAEVAFVSAPVSLQQPTTPETAAAIEETVFSLAAYTDAPPVTAPTPEAEPAGNLAFVTAESVNVREGPGTQNPVLTRLTRGEAVTIVSTDASGWALIIIEGDGLEGFISLDYLSSSAP